MSSNVSTTRSATASSGTSGSTTAAGSSGSVTATRLSRPGMRGCGPRGIAGWQVTPDFTLVRGEEELGLRDVLAALAERIDVRVLLWAGPPLPVFRPHRSDVREVRDKLRRGTNIRCELDARERTFHCHHEKLVIVDDEVAFVGGIDLTSLSGDRFDGPAHPADGSLGWHDVATRLEGPAVADVAEHFRQRWHEIAGESLSRPGPPRPVGKVELQVVRTVPEKTYGFA